MVIEQASQAKAEGNNAYAAGDLGLATSKYTECLSMWEDALGALPREATLQVGEVVRYHKKGFGTVMSAFPLFDEYFLKDSGTDQAIWVGDPGGDLYHFARKDLEAVPTEFFDLRLLTLQNLAAVCLRKDDLEGASQWADQALAMDGRAPKALMRKGAALLRDGQPGPASDALAAAKKALPSDPEIRKLLREAEMKRSPTWVCVSGCCGPWGIVCGGPVSSAMPQVVPPAQRIYPEETEAVDQTPDSLPANEKTDCSSCESDSGNSSPRGGSTTAPEQASTDADDVSSVPALSTQDEEPLPQIVQQRTPFQMEMSGSRGSDEASDAIQAAPAECGLQDDSVKGAEQRASQLRQLMFFSVLIVILAALVAFCGVSPGKAVG